MKIVELVCELCGGGFTRKAGEHNRNLKRGRKVFCSLACSGKAMWKPKLYSWATSQESKAILIARNLTGFKADEFTPFKETLRRAKRRKKECLLTLEDLKLVWGRQEGKCAYLGIELFLPVSNYYKEPISPLYLASLDRIDSNLPYTLENVQFVSMLMNFAKNKFSETVVLEFMAACASAPPAKFTR